MTEREKLFRLLLNAFSLAFSLDSITGLDWNSCELFFPDVKFQEAIDYLLENGVTVKEWVLVSESPKENGIYCVMVENHKNRKVKMRAYARYRNGRWLDLYDNWENRCWHVTHWMPLPEPPKEKEHKNAEWEE